VYTVTDSDFGELRVVQVGDGWAIYVVATDSYLGLTYDTMEEAIEALNQFIE